MSTEPESNPMPRPLGEYLASLRLSKRMSLREVEEASEKAVSNAYLSQLEKGRIGKPSPNILHALATIYGVPYESLMEKAGYIVSKASLPKGARHGRVATFANDDLTPAEEEELRRYLGYLRSFKGKPRNEKS
jgi:transcriptional regulator with XRE-family HTH domain